MFSVLLALCEGNPLAVLYRYMMKSCHGNAFCITGPLWGESTGNQWIRLSRDPGISLVMSPVNERRRYNVRGVGWEILWTVCCQYTKSLPWLRNWTEISNIMNQDLLLLDQCQYIIEDHDELLETTVRGGRFNSGSAVLSILNAINDNIFKIIDRYSNINTNDVLFCWQHCACWWPSTIRC